MENEPILIQTLNTIISVRVIHIILFYAVYKIYKGMTRLGVI